MTWSILARDHDGTFGIAIASRFFAVGSLCPHSRRELGALSTQALMNPLYGPRGLALLEAGNDAAQVVAKLTAEDAGREHRQLHLIDARGRVAAHTGSACIDWCGHRAGEGFSVAGNMLAGPQVLDATIDAFLAQPDRPLALRLLAALDAGDAAGGDKRGRQSAGLRIHAHEEYPQLDLRVDDHEQPFIELRRLYARSLERFQPFVACLPSAARPAGITDRTLIEAEIARFAATHPPVR